MTMNEERESFSLALHDAGHSIDVPDDEQIYQWGLRRGRQLRRRRAAGSALTGAVALGVAAALALGLSGVGRDAPKPAPVATKAPADLPEYMAMTLKALLPAGAELDTKEGISSLTGSGYGMGGNNGTWRAYANAEVVYQQQSYSLGLTIAQNYVNTDCYNGFDLTDCSQRTLDGAEYVAITMGTGKGSPDSYSATLNFPGGRSIQLQVNPNLYAKDPHEPFTTAQLQHIVAAAAWKPVLNALPALVKCPSGLEPPAGKDGALYFVCKATGKRYPVQGDFYAYPGSS